MNYVKRCKFKVQLISFHATPSNCDINPEPCIANCGQISHWWIVLVQSQCSDTVSLIVGHVTRNHQIPISPVLCLSSWSFVTCYYWIGVKRSCSHVCFPHGNCCGRFGVEPNLPAKQKQQFHLHPVNCCCINHLCSAFCACRSANTFFTIENHGEPDGCQTAIIGL